MSRIYKYYDLSRITNAKYMKIDFPISWYSIIATWFFVGRIGIASGTLGSIAFYPVYYLILMRVNNALEAEHCFWIATIVLFILGLLSVSAFQNKTKTFDHSCVVIDEIIGMSTLFSISFEWLLAISQNFVRLVPISDINIAFILGLILFRVFDITKPWFIKYIDRRYKNSFGIILDDILAACFASAILYGTYMVFTW